MSDPAKPPTRAKGSARQRQRAIVAGLLNAFSEVPLGELEATVTAAMLAIRARGREPSGDTPGVPDALDDPGAILDASYERQLQQLHQFKQGIAELESAKRRLELQAAQLRADGDRMEKQAEQADEAGRRDLARTTRIRVQSAEQQLAGLNHQIADLDARQQKLSDEEPRLSAKLEAFRSQQAIVQAQYAAAVAQVRMGDAVGRMAKEAEQGALAMDIAAHRAEQQKPTGEKPGC